MDGDGWRCTACGELKVGLGSTAWRWAGEVWEHRCEGLDPQVGYMRAQQDAGVTLKLHTTGEIARVAVGNDRVTFYACGKPLAEYRARACLAAVSAQLAHEQARLARLVTPAHDAPEEAHEAFALGLARSLLDAGVIVPVNAEQVDDAWSFKLRAVCAAHASDDVHVIRRSLDDLPVAGPQADPMGAAVARLMPLATRAYRRFIGCEERMVDVRIGDPPFVRFDEINAPGLEIVREMIATDVPFFACLSRAREGGGRTLFSAATASDTPLGAVNALCTKLENDEKGHRS